MCREIENFCEKWMGYLMRPRPPPKLAGVVKIFLNLFCFRAAAYPGRLAGILTVLSYFLSLFSS